MIKRPQGITLYYTLKVEKFMNSNCNKKAREALNVYFSNKLRFGQTFAIADQT